MIFKNKKAELVKDKALIEIEEFAERILKNLNWSFDVMLERDNYKDMTILKDSQIKELENKLKEKTEKIAQLNYEVISLNKDLDKVFNFLEKITSVVKKYDDNIDSELKELKSNRYRVVSLKPTKVTKQEMKIKNSVKASKIAKIMKEEI